MTGRAGPVVGLDGRHLAMAHGTGVATYTATLARSIPSMGFGLEVLDDTPRRARPWRWLAAASPFPARSTIGPPSPKGWATRRSPDVFRTAQAHFDIWRRVRPLGGAGLPDLMHWTHPLPLRLAGRPNVTTVHDVIPLLHPGLTGMDPSRSRRLLAQVVAASDHIVTDTEASRRDIVATLGAAPERVTSTGLTVATAPADAEPPCGLQPGRYWLAVGTVEPRKNLPRLIEAWRASGTEHPLCLAGPDGWRAAEALAAAGDELGHRVLRLPWLSRPALLAAVRGARALLMPSLAEGFGLPVLEAMALGTPVLTSGRGALAEVAGGAALLVDPEDGAEIAQAIRALDRDADLRGRLAASGPVRARHFAADAWAARMAAIYRAVLKAHHSGGLGEGG